MKSPLTPETVATANDIVNLYKTFDYSAHTVDADKFIEMSVLADTLILDLRSESCFIEGHIKGAKHLGSDVTKESLEKQAPNLNTRILVYCTNSFLLSRKMSLTHTLVPQIYALGYQNLYYLDSLDLLTSVDFNRINKFQWEGKKIGEA